VAVAVWPEGRLPSEKGLLGFTGREADRPVRDVLLDFRDLVDADMDWADSRKARFRKRASIVKLAALVLTAASTVVLGIPAIPNRSAVALPMVALVTLFGAVDAFFNWRSRWVLMEETQYRLNRLRDEVDYYVATTPSHEVNQTKLALFFANHQEIWNDVSRRWIEFRKIDPASKDQPPPPAGGDLAA
jgi:hypothetical protein